MATNQAGEKRRRPLRHMPRSALIPSAVTNNSPIKKGSISSSPRDRRPPSLTCVLSACRIHGPGSIRLQSEQVATDGNVFHIVPVELESRDGLVQHFLDKRPGEGVESLLLFVIE